MPSLEMPELTLDEIDDLLYFTRVNEADDLQQTLLELSRKYSCSQKDLVHACVDPESRNTVLHYASANGFAELLRSLLTILEVKSESEGEDKTPTTIQSIVNAANKEGNTPLHWASVNGQLDAVKVLIDAGADASKENLAGYLAVAEAERAGKGNVVEYLLDRSQQNVSPEDLTDLPNDGNDTNGTRDMNGNGDVEMNG